MHRAARGERLVEDGADRIDVGAIVWRLAARFFGRLVVDQAAVVAVLVEAALRRQLERRNLGPALRADDDGVGAEAAVSEPVGMSIGDGVGDLNGDLDRAADVHRAARRLGAQRLAFLKLEGQVHAAVVLADVEQRRHVRMRQRAQPARPGDQTLARSDA